MTKIGLKDSSTVVASLLYGLEEICSHGGTKPQRIKRITFRLCVRMGSNTPTTLTYAYNAKDQMESSTVYGVTTNMA